MGKSNNNCITFEIYVGLPPITNVAVLQLQYQQKHHYVDETECP